MGLLDKFNAQFKKSLSKKDSASKFQFGSIDYSIPIIPCVIEKKNDPWVWYGEDNLYPLMVSDLRNGSSIHNSIIKTKTKMTAGDGFLINGAKTEEESKAKYEALPSDVKAAYDAFLKNQYGKETTLSILAKHCDDLQTQGQSHIEIVKNIDNTKISTIKYVNTENVRSGKLESDEIKNFYYHRDWKKVNNNNNKPTELYAFDKEDKEHLNQVIFTKFGKNDYYGELPYKGCLTWIQVDFKMGIYHLSSIDNGMNPGMHWKFYKLPADENEKQSILRDLDRAYKGATKVNKRIVTFSDGKELATDVEPINTTNLDKQLLLLAELCDKKILTGHQLTSPLLAGVSISGSLGGNTELLTAAVLFDNLSMASDRNMAVKPFQDILDFNKIPIQLEINPFKLFKGMPQQTQKPA